MQKNFLFSLKTLLVAASVMHLLAGEALSQVQKQQVVGKNWLIADTNHDGNVSKEEYLELNRKRAEAVFNTMDENHDGTVTPEELQVYYDKMEQTKK